MWKEVMNIEANIKIFEDLLTSTNREGIEKLIEYCRTSDFYTAPSSTRYHLSVEGGLLQHSLNVYEVLKNLLNKEVDGLYSYVCAGKTIDKITEDNLIIMSLLHDICKVKYFGTEVRNKKNEDGVWVKYNAYTVDEQFPFGHGEKSVFILNNYIKLNPNEAMAIRWHMGFPDDFQGKQAYGKAVEKCPVILALHTADMMASRFVEGTSSNKELFI